MITHDGVFYGEGHALRRLDSAPKKRQPFLLAFAIHPDETKDLERLAAEGWQLVDPACVAGTPDQYVRSFKRPWLNSESPRAATRRRCGWFSDPRVCYLASGKPVVAQETGFAGSC